MAELNDPWTWWFDRLAGKPAQMNPDTPHAGFYREQFKERYGARKTFMPVAYWPGEDGQLCCRIGDEDVSPERGQAIWERVGNHPVTEEAYREVAQNGGLWPDEHEAAPMQGDNRPPEPETFEEIRDAIEDLAHEAAERIKGPPIADQEEADRIANLADRLAELHKRADETRAEERKPFDLGMKEVARKWAPLLLRAETYKNLKFKLLTPWLTKQKEQQTKQAEVLAAEGKPPPAETPRPRAGTRGRAMSLKTNLSAQVDDHALALAFFADSDDIKKCVQTLADRAVRAGITVPGCTVLKETKAV
jgi:hypothetical protein